MTLRRGSEQCGWRLTSTLRVPILARRVGRLRRFARWRDGCPRVVSACARLPSLSRDRSHRHCQPAATPVADAGLTASTPVSELSSDRKGRTRFERKSPFIPPKFLAIYRAAVLIRKRTLECNDECVRHGA